MAKKVYGMIMIALLLFMIPSAALGGVRISFKLSAGLANVRAGDVNPGTTAFFDWWRAYYNLPVGSEIGKGSKALHWGYEFDADLIFELNSHIGIGIGYGYQQSTKNSMEIINSNVERAHSELSAMPIRLGLFFSLPLSTKVNFTANVGTSYYLEARYSARWSTDIPLGMATEKITELSTNAKKHPIGLHGGLGIEYRLSKTTSLYIETKGRFARFGGLEGSSEFRSDEGAFTWFSETGKLYYESAPMLPNAPRLIMVQSTPPAGPGGQPREAVVDFSGFSLQAGVRIYF
jgi:hypothetical protein